MAPSTPPPPSSDEFAALTMASTASVVMSARRACRLTGIGASLMFSDPGLSGCCDPARSNLYNAAMSKRGWILFLALGVLWGMPYLLIRIAVAAYDPVVVAGTRTLIGSLLLLPIALHRKELTPAFRKWKWLLAFTLVEITVPWVLLGH